MSPASCVSRRIRPESSASLDRPVGSKDMERTYGSVCVAPISVIPQRSRMSLASPACVGNRPAYVN